MSQPPVAPIRVPYEVAMQQQATELSRILAVCIGPAVRFVSAAFEASVELTAPSKVVASLAIVDRPGVTVGVEVPVGPNGQPPPLPVLCGVVGNARQQIAELLLSTVAVAAVSSDTHEAVLATKDVPPAAEPTLQLVLPPD